MSNYKPALLALIIVPVVFVMGVLVALSPRLTADGDRDRLMELLSSTLSAQGTDEASTRMGFGCESIGVDCADVGSWAQLQATDGSPQSLAKLCQSAEEIAGRLPAGFWHATSYEQKLTYGGVPSAIVKASPVVPEVRDECVRAVTSGEDFQISAALERSVRVKDGTATLTVLKDPSTDDAPWELAVELDGAPAW